MKAIFFSTIIVLTALTLVTFIAIQKSLISFYGEKIAVETRVNSMNNFYEGITTDAGKALDIISTRAMSAAISNVIVNGIGLTEANATIKELSLNGSMNGVQEPLMESATFTDWMRKIEEIGILNGFYTNITIQNLEVKPYDSFNILVVAWLGINLTDSQGVASIERNVSINQVVSIEGLEDPTYPLHTNGKGSIIIYRGRYWNNFTQSLVSGSGGNSWFYGKSVVISSSNQADIQNVQNKNQKILVTDSTAGIESLVNSFGGVVSETSVSGITIPYISGATNAMSIIPTDTYILVDSTTGKVWYIDNLKNSIGYYHPSLKGASFLDRLEGKLEVQTKYQTDQMIGMESLVDKNYLATFGIVVSYDKTNVDHLYFSGSEYISNKVKGFDDNFRIDEEMDDKKHSEIYGVADILR